MERKRKRKIEIRGESERQALEGYRKAKESGRPCAHYLTYWENTHREDDSHTQSSVFGQNAPLGNVYMKSTIRQNI